MNAASITLAMVAYLAPPAAYDHVPLKAYVVTTMPAAMMERLCPSPEGDTLGCSIPGTGLVYVLEGLSLPVRKLIIRHEFAHLNGWRHAH